MKKLWLTICLFCVSFFCFAESHAAEIDSNEGVFVLELSLQPYEKAVFTLDGQVVTPTLLSTDKTLGIFEVLVPYGAYELTVSAKGYRPALVPLYKLFPRFSYQDFKLQGLLFSHNTTSSIMPSPTTSTTPKTTNRQSFFLSLDKEDSLATFYKAINCKLQPKSCQFIDEVTLIVPLLDEEGFQVINIETGETRLVSPPKNYAVQKGFVESLYLPERQEIWVSQMPTACVHVFSSVDFLYKTTVQSKGLWSKVLAYNPTTDRVYLSNWISFNIGVINPNTYKEESLIPLFNVPRGIAVSKDGKNLYFAEFENENGSSLGRVVKFSLEKRKIEKTFGSAGAKRHCVTDYAKDRLYVSDMALNRIEIYSLTDDSLVKTVPVYHNPNTIDLACNGKYLVVSCRGPNNPDLGYLYKGHKMGQVHIINTETFETLCVIEGGNQPTGLAVSPDQKTFAFSDFLDARIRVYKIAD